MSIIKSINRKILLPIIKKSSLAELVSFFSSKTNIILNYHGVVQNYDPSLTKNHLPLHQFEEQMNYFKKHFTILSTEEIFESRITKSENKLKKCIAITFDDGYKNNLETAFPVLNSLNIPATIFVTGQSVVNATLPLWYDVLDILNSQLSWPKLKDEIINTGLKNFNCSTFKDYGSFKNYIKYNTPEIKGSILELLNKNATLKTLFDQSNSEYWKLLNEMDLLTISKSKLIEIGSHGLTHSNLDKLNDVTLNHELIETKSLLENCIKKNVSSIAFPDGAYNQTVKDACRNAGYKRMLAVDLRIKTDLTDTDILPRLSISNTTTSNVIIVTANLSFFKIGF